jgi:hypothetical protein
MKRVHLFVAGLVLFSALPVIRTTAGGARRSRRDGEDPRRGLQRSQVMQVTSILTDGFGPRLTNSPASKPPLSGPRRSLPSGA